MSTNAIPFVYGFVVLSVFYFAPFYAENSFNDDRNVASVSTSSSTAKAQAAEERLGFVQAFLKTISVIFVSEIGDKTFFIAAIMAMKHPRAMVFLGAILALAFMTIISVLGGLAMSIIPKIYTYYGSVILFLLFGLKMIFDGIRMSPHEGQEEYEEVQAELRKREEEHAKKLKQLAKPKKSSVSPVNDNAVVQTFPVATTNVFPEPTTIVVDESDDNVRGPNSGNDDCKENGQMQFEKETLTKDIECGYVNKNSKVKIIQVLSHIIVQAFTLTFVAEWGDRSQLATFLLASKDDKFGITIGAIAGHSICTGIAVTGGRFVAQKISVRTVTIFGGIVFIICALYILLREESGDTKLI